MLFFKNCRQSDYFRALIGLLLVAGHINLVEGACRIPNGDIQNCVATSLQNPWAISVCLLQRYDTSSLIRCVGELNEARCYHVEPEVDSKLRLDNIRDDQVCVTPRNTLVLAASVAAEYARRSRCRPECESAYGKLNACPYEGSEREYRECLCARQFNNHERDCIDSCAGVLKTRSDPLDFGRLLRDGSREDGTACSAFSIDSIMNDAKSYIYSFGGTATTNFAEIPQPTRRVMRRVR